MVVEHFARDILLCFGFPQYGVEIREVMMDVYSIIAPSTQGPAAKLWTLGNRKQNTIEEKIVINEWIKWVMRKKMMMSQTSQGLPDLLFDLPHVPLMCQAFGRSAKDYTQQHVFISCTGSSCKISPNTQPLSCPFYILHQFYQTNFLACTGTTCCSYQQRASQTVMVASVKYRPVVLSRPTASKAFSYPSGLTDGNRWILVSSTRWRIRWLPDKYSRHMNCIRRRSNSRPSTSLPWEPAV